MTSFLARLGPAIRRITSIGATISRTMAGTVVRKCRRQMRAMEVRYDVRGRLFAMRVSSHKGNVTGIRGTVRPVFAAGPRSSQSKVKFSFVRTFVSDIRMRSGMKRKADMGVAGAVNGKDEV